MADETEKKETPAEEKKETPAEEKKEKEEGTEKKMSLDANLDTAAILQMLADETDGYKDLVDSQGSDDFSAKLMAAMYAKMCKMAADDVAMCDKMAKMADENKAYMDELADLKTFKANQEQEQFAITVDSTMKEIENTVEMSKEEMDSIRDESKKYNLSNIDIWKNMAKAKAFEHTPKTKKQEGPTKIGLPWGNVEPKKKGLWD